MFRLFACEPMDRQLDRGSRRRRGPIRRRGRLPLLECLETRITPSTTTATWTGRGSDSNWTTAVNWSGNTAPQSGDDLVFPSNAASFDAVDNFPAGTSFNSLTISGSGYSLSEAAGDSLSLTNGISATYTSGASTDTIDTDLGGGTVAVGAGGELVLGGVISGTAGLSLSGGGKLDLTGTNTYTGATSVTGSGTTLLVDGTAGAVQVNSGAVLGGSGTVGAVTSTGGTVSPGDGPGVLKTGSLTLDGNSTFTAALDGNTPGNGTTGYDQAIAGGAVNLGGATLNLSIGGGYTPALGDQLTILKNNSGSGVTGTFAGLPEGSIVTTASGLFRITYLGGTTFHDVVLTAVASSTTTIAPSSQTSTYGSAATFIAHVAGQSAEPTPSGTVTFYDGNPNSGGTEVAIAPVDPQGDATGVISTLHVTSSPHQIYAVYTPDVSSLYAGSSSAQPASFTVDPATLTITARNASKVYGAALPAFTFSYSGFENGDNAASLTTGPSISTTATQFSPVIAGGYTITPQGAVDPDYSFHYVSGTLTVTPATLTAALTGTVEKTYDGTTSATLTSGNYQLSGVLNNDSVSINHPDGTYDTKDVGTGKTVTVTGLALTGTAAGNYQLASTTISGPVGQIDAKALTVTGLSVNNKVYDGTTADTLNTASAALSGVVGGDVVSLNTSGATASFANKNVGTAKPVTVSGLSLTGPDAGNYTLTQPTGLTADITPAALTVLDLNANTKVYDGTTAASLNLGTARLSGIVDHDQVSLSPTGYTATFSTKNVGAPIPVTVSGLSLTGADAGNYTLNPLGAVSGAITPAPLTITANPASKVYGAALPAFSVSYNGFVPGDSPASLTTLPAVTTTATTASPAGSYSLNVGGASAIDYAITYVPGTLVITRASTSASLSSSVSTAVVGQDDSFTVQVAPISPGAGNPTGQVTFLVDGSPIGTAVVDPATGRATFSTTAIGRGTHTVTASYSGDANFQPMGTSSNSLVVTTASTQPVLTAQAVRNKHGKILSVHLTARVLVVAPGSGVPTGTVTFFRKGHRLKATVLSNGTAVVNLKLNQALKKSFTVQYGGDANFRAGTSAPLVVTRASLTPATRPLTAFFNRQNRVLT